MKNSKDMWNEDSEYWGSWKHITENGYFITTENFARNTYLFKMRIEDKFLDLNDFK